MPLEIQLGYSESCRRNTQLHCENAPALLSWQVQDLRIVVEEAVHSRLPSSSGGDSIHSRGPLIAPRNSLRLKRLPQIRRLPDGWMSGKRFA